VGTGSTHGKGTVQTLIDLDRATGANLDLGVFKLTVQQFFRVNGGSTQREGVTPDIVLPDPAGYIEAGERELGDALPWAEIRSPLSTRQPPRPPPPTARRTPDPRSGATASPETSG